MSSAVGASYDSPMESARSFAVVIGAAVALLTFLGSLPLGPLRLTSWRLRKHMETVACIEGERFDAQRAVLLRRTDTLASKVAAFQRVPTPWAAYVVGAFFLGIFGYYWLAFLWVPPPDDAGFLFWETTVVESLIALYFAWFGIARFGIYTWRERRRFEHANFPEKFGLKADPLNAIGLQFRAMHRKSLGAAEKRARAMKRDGTWPKDLWPPRTTGRWIWRAIRQSYERDKFRFGRR